MLRKIITAASLLLIISMSFVSAVSTVQAEEPAHNLVVNTYWVEAFGYVDGQQTAEIIVSREGEVDAICEGTDPIEGEYYFFMDCMREIETGDLVQLYVEGVLVKEHNMIYLTLEMADLESGYFSGQSEQGREIEMVVCHPDYECLSMYTNTEGGTFWEVSFMDLPFYPDWFAAFAVDDDGDRTQADFDIPSLPTFEIEPNHGWVCTGGWGDGVNLTLRIKFDKEDPDTDSFLMDWLTTEGWGGGCFEYGEQVGPGMYVSVTDDLVLKETWVAPLTFEAVDDDGTAWGFGAGEWGGHVCLNHDGDCQEIMVDPDGDWSAVFPWYDPLTADLSGAHVVTPDEDGDGTIVHLFHGEPPMPAVIHVYPQFELVNGWFWPLWEEVTLVVDDDLDPENGNLYFDTGVSEPALWSPDEPFVSFDLRPFDLQAGHFVIMFSGDIFQIHQVTNLTITGVDQVADLATGTADAGTDVMVVVNWEEGTDNFVTADGSGIWLADYSGQFDLSYGDMVTAFQQDDTMNMTLVEKMIVTPGGLIDEIQNLPDELVSDQIKNSLIKKVENAYSSYIKGNQNAAVNKLEALLNEIDALVGNKISEEIVRHLHILVYNLINNFQE